MQHICKKHTLPWIQIQWCNLTISPQHNFPEYFVKPPTRCKIERLLEKQLIIISWNLSSIRQKRNFKIFASYFWLIFLTHDVAFRVEINITNNTNVCHSNLAGDISSLKVRIGMELGIINNVVSHIFSLISLHELKEFSSWEQRNCFCFYQWPHKCPLRVFTSAMFVFLFFFLFQITTYKSWIQLCLCGSNSIICTFHLIFLCQGKTCLELKT